MAAAWAAAAALSAQPACADPPSTTTAVDAWVTVREWVDRMAVPPNAGSPEGVAAAAVVLRLDGRPVGVGTSHEKGSSLPRAVAQAIERVRQDRVIEGLSTKEQDAVGRRLTMELELAGPAAPMVGRTVPEVGQRVEPARGALSMRRNDRWAWTYPSVLQAGNMAGDATAILAALLRELDVDASELPTLELPASMAFYMAPTVRLAQQAPTRPPFEVVRGNEVVPLTALGPAGRQEFAAAMARHLRSHAPPLPSGADPVALAALRARGLQGDYRPHVDLYRPMTASPADQAVTAYALARYSACPEAPEAERNAARAAATEILRALSDVTEGEDPPLESEAAVSVRPSSRITERIATRRKASVPGRSIRWRSASSAVSVRRGSTTMSVRAGSREISRRVRRARGIEWECHGFLPRKSATSQRSKSARVAPPMVRCATQNSPVFSCASALER